MIESKAVSPTPFQLSLMELLWGASAFAAEVRHYSAIAHYESDESVMLAMAAKIGVYAVSAFVGYFHANNADPSSYEGKILQMVSGYLNLSTSFVDTSTMHLQSAFNGLCFGHLFHRIKHGEQKSSMWSEIFSKDASHKAQNSSSNKSAKKIDAAELKKALDNKIIGQQKAKEKIVQAIGLHLLTENTNTPKPARILLIGPTGSGKTSMVKALAEALDRPYICVDAASLAPEGLRGTNFSQTWEQLISAANGSISKAERGIVFIDEADKLFDKNVVPSEKNYRQLIQQQLLKALEGAEMPYGASFFSRGTINTENMIFVLGGVFDHLPKMNSLSEVTTEQLERFGMTPEITGRISDIAQLELLNADDLRKVLFSSDCAGSIWKWKKLFRNLNCELEIDSEVYDQLIAYSLNKQTGVRGLDSVTRQFLNPYLEEAQKLYAHSLSLSRGRDRKDVSPKKIHLTMENWLKTDMAKQIEFQKTYPSLEEIERALESEVIGQEEAKKVITQAVYLQQLNIAENLGLPKGNILMIGPSGSGKTFMMEVLSDKLNIPLAIMDASKITRAGYVGSKPEEVLVKLLENSHGDIRAAEKGIVVLDEMDKVFEDALSSNYGSSSITGRTVLNQLLRMLQGEQIKVHYQGREVTVDTTHIQFVLAGAFSKTPHLYAQDEIEESDLLRAGMTPEFLGRIGYKTKLSPIGREEFKDYLTGSIDKALLKQWKETFKHIGATLQVEDSAIERWIAKCLNNQTGIRGLQNLVRSELSQRLVEAQQKALQGALQGPVIVR